MRRGIHLRHAPGQGVLADAFGENFAAFGGEFLGVVQPHDAAPWVENHRRGEYRAEKGAAACFVQAGDTLPAFVPRRALESRGTEPLHRRGF